MFGGEGGIRTLDTLLTYTPLAGERLQPLGHFTINFYSGIFISIDKRSQIARQSLISLLIAKMYSNMQIMITYAILNTCHCWNIKLYLKTDRHMRRHNITSTENSKTIHRQMMN